MAEENKPTPLDPAKIDYTRFEGMQAMPLYEMVKAQIFQYWTVCNMYLGEVNQRRAALPTITEIMLGEHSDKFKTSVLRLWELCRVKLTYCSDKECAKKLLKIDSKIDFKMSLKDTETVYRLLTEFLEESGLTRYEKTKGKASEYLIDGLDERAD